VKGLVAETMMMTFSPVRLEGVKEGLIRRDSASRDRMRKQGERKTTIKPKMMRLIRVQEETTYFFLLLFLFSISIVFPFRCGNITSPTLYGKFFLHTFTSAPSY